MGFVERVHSLRESRGSSGRSSHGAARAFDAQVRLAGDDVLLECGIGEVESAVEDVLNEGFRTYDIMSEGKKKVGTREMGDLIAGKAGG